MKPLRRQLRDLSDELRLAVDAMGEKPADLDKALAHLRDVELQLHDTRRSLEQAMHGRRKSG